MVKKMKLTRNFSLAELIKSDTAIRRGIDNNPNADQIEKLKLLCENEWVRFFSIETSNSIEVFAYKPTNGWEIFKEDEYLT